MMRGLLVAQGEEAVELGLGGDRPELTKVNQTSTPFPILPGFQSHIFVVFTIGTEAGPRRTEALLKLSQASDLCLL